MPARACIVVRVDQAGAEHAGVDVLGMAIVVRVRRGELVLPVQFASSIEGDKNCVTFGAPRTWSASFERTPKPKESRESFVRPSRVSFSSRCAGGPPDGVGFLSEAGAGADVELAGRPRRPRDVRLGGVGAGPGAVEADKTPREADDPPRLARSGARLDSRRVTQERRYVPSRVRPPPSG